MNEELRLRRLFDGAETVEKIVRDRRYEAHRAVEATQDDDVLNQDPDQWARELLVRYVPRAPSLLLAQKSISEPQSNREPFLFVPFEGDPELFDLKLDRGPGSRGMAGYLVGGELRLELSSWGIDNRGQEHVEMRVGEAQKILDAMQAQFDLLQQHLLESLPKAIEKRQLKIASRRSAISELGIPIRLRDDAPTVMREPGIVRRARPREPSRSGISPKPGEPAMSDEMFEHIIEVVRATGRSMSRAPKSYEKWGEEDRRQVFVLMLNTHYQGAVAAEAFNFTGKTDILVRVEDRNVFIGECKLWDGAKGFERAIDQLFGYAAWDDVRLALIVFVDRRDLTRVVREATESLREHRSFRAAVARSEDRELRAKMAWPGDEERVVILHVTFVHTVT